MKSALRKHRTSIKATLDDLAAAFGVNKTTIMRWEQNRIPAERVLDVERVTGVSRHRLRPDIFGRPQQ